MIGPCVNCGADAKVCKECDWYNGVWVSKHQCETRLKAEREKIAKDVADKMCYMGSCLNEENIILGIITGKRETLDSLYSVCKSESCESNGTAISKADYEAKLKADMMNMLEELKAEIEKTVKEKETIDKKWANGLHYSEKIIQQKIDALKDDKE